MRSLIRILCLTRSLNRSLIRSLIRSPTRSLTRSSSSARHFGAHRLASYEDALSTGRGLPALPRRHCGSLLPQRKKSIPPVIKTCVLATLPICKTIENLGGKTYLCVGQASLALSKVENSPSQRRVRSPVASLLSLRSSEPPSRRLVARPRPPRP